ncbi:ABC transporter substrate-binding protein [Duganella sp. CF458]|uniref:ABC transporter substrate-binding protein n=1 Tax=Duganella sp. CF458 TaxID=1884368 RepID=UPI001113D8D9|nr:hypothetical protein [Duganella sp. CF458]
MLLAVWALAAHGAGAHVLLLNSYSPGRPGIDRVTDAFVQRLRESGIPLEHIHVEFLHLEQPNAEIVTPARRALLVAQYGGGRVDMLVALQQPALNFALRELADLAPEAPLLTDSQPSTVQLASSKRPVFLYSIVPDLGATVNEITQLMPRTRRIVIPGGVSDADRAFQRQAEVDVAPWLRKLQVEFLQNMSWAEQMRYIGNLTPDTVVVAGMFNRDRDGYSQPTIDAARDTMRAANVPVFSLFDSVVGEGAVGGAVRNLQQSGRELGERALALMEGGQPAGGTLTKVPVGPVQSLYDWRQLERWNIDPSPLKGATILFKPPSLWQAYRGAVLGAGGVIALLAGLLAVMLLRRRRFG